MLSRCEVLDLRCVAARDHLDHLGDLVVAERLLVAEQREARGEPVDVPGEGSDVRLVEVVHIEDQASFAVHVRAEVGGVEITLDPHAAALAVRERVAVTRDVGVVEAGTAAVEGERARGHLAELAAERGGITSSELAERLSEDARHEGLALLRPFAPDQVDDARSAGHPHGR